MSLYGHIILFLLVRFLGTKLLGGMVSLCFTL